jgi:hypothetical protein
MRTKLPKTPPFIRSFHIPPLFSNFLISFLEEQSPLFTWPLSGAKFTTQLEITTSTELSAAGKCSISPNRNDIGVLVGFAFFRCAASLGYRHRAKQAEK